MERMRLAISDVAARVGLEPSAIRYYERIGLLPVPERAGGKRRYDESVMMKLAVIQRARRTGFTLAEIRQLFFGFKGNTPASKRWQKLCRKKLSEIDGMIREMRVMQELLDSMIKRCHCMTLEQCGRGILGSDFADPAIRIALRSGKRRKGQPLRRLDGQRSGMASRLLRR
jgi:DNA-binding transcriptional MerR regulator